MTASSGSPYWERAVYGRSVGRVRGVSFDKEALWDGRRAWNGYDCTERVGTGDWRRVEVPKECCCMAARAWRGGC